MKSLILVFPLDLFWPTSGQAADVDPACRLTAADKVSNAQMAFDDFDQRGASPATWRQLSHRGCDLAAVEAAGDHLIGGPFETASEQRAIRFQIAQSLGMHRGYDEAALLTAGSKASQSDATGDLDWNIYVEGTWVFKRDKGVLAQARDTLVAESGHGDQLSGAALSGLLSSFVQPYRIAYQTACRAGLQISKESPAP